MQKLPDKFVDIENKNKGSKSELNDGSDTRFFMEKRLPHLLNIAEELLTWCIEEDKKGIYKDLLKKYRKEYEEIKGKQTARKEIRTGLTTEQEGINILKNKIPAGEEFGTSRVQRLLRWGYNRSYRTMLIAIEAGQAEHGTNEFLFKFVNK